MVIEERDRALSVKLFYLNSSSSSVALREYQGLTRGPVSTNGLKKKKMKFENTGDFDVASGRGRQSIPMEVVYEVAVAGADRAEHAPNSAASARPMSHELGVPCSTVIKILRCILHWYPYKIQTVQQLKPHDPQQRLDFALHFLARMEVGDMWPENILWTDEAHFTLGIWDSTKLLVVHQQPLHSAYVTVVWIHKHLYSWPVFL